MTAVAEVFEVEADLSWDIVPPKSKKLPPPPAPEPDPDEMTDRQRECVAEYEWMTSLGLSHNEASARVGLAPHSMDTLLRRAGWERPLNPAEQRSVKVFDRLVASGKPFTLEAVPETTNPQFAAGLAKRAESAGRIVQVGRAKDFNIWKGVTA